MSIQVIYIELRCILLLGFLILLSMFLYDQARKTSVLSISHVSPFQRVHS